MVFTRFMDMCSGGSPKLKYEYIYIEAPLELAKMIFKNKLGINPDKITCSCCGSDYIIDEEIDLEQATAFERNCEFVYRNPQGVVCSQNEGWVSGIGNLPGYTSKYEEVITQDKWRIQKSYITVEEHIKKSDVLVIFEKDINALDKVGVLKKIDWVYIDDEDDE